MTDTGHVGPRTRPGGRSARVRSAVLRATLEELAAVGYASFGIEGVAKRAGVHKTTVYRRWRNSENLLLEAMLEHWRAHVPIPDTGALRSDLLAYGKAVVAGLRDPEIEAVTRAVASIGDPESPLTTAGHAFWAARLDLASQIVDRAVARKEVSPGVEPRIVIEAVIGPVYFRLLLSSEKLDRRFLEQLADVGVAAAQAASPS
jgi:AcrR family transcriptional regulator